MTFVRSFAETRKDRNVYDSWYNKDARIDGVKKHAHLRLREDVFVAAHTPKFQLSKENSFFLMGSCFARGLERILIARDFDVKSTSGEFSRWELQYEKGSAMGITNRYNTASIFNEFNWHVEGKGVPDSSLIETRDGVFFDPHATPVTPPTSLEEQRQRRGIWSDICSNISKVDVVVLTLGLVEVWYDKETALYCNATPDARLAAKYPDRFEMHILNYNDNLENLEGVYKILKSKNPDVKIIITVSPVPLIKTFSGEDIVKANTYSKSTLRAAAGDFTRDKPDVDYFPSYEIAMNSNSDLAWAEDKRHILGAFSRNIMNQFLGYYLNDSAENDEYDIEMLG